MSIKSIIIIAIILALGAWAGTQKYNLNKAQRDLKEALVQRDTAGVARDKAIGIASTNATTISRLEREKEDLNTALNKLQENRTANRATAAVRETTIRSTSTVPANAAPAAPVLGSLIADIQTDRVRRRTVKQ